MCPRLTSTSSFSRSNLIYLFHNSGSSSFIYVWEKRREERRGEERRGEERTMAIDALV
jgi:hypothetical protein